VLVPFYCGAGNGGIVVRKSYAKIAGREALAIGGRFFKGTRLAMFM